MDVEMEGLTDLRKDRWLDGWMDGCGDGGLTDLRKDRWMDG